jgi:acetoin:2,6-dichlorophenolindophenol oxidoreductase subunit alpha
LETILESFLDERATDRYTSPMTSMPEAAAGLSLERRLDLLRAMIEIRLFEDECHRMFAQGLVRGSTHLGQGQEAVSVGACAALRDGDTMTCTYRGHAATLAMGAPLDRAFGEILGKAGGLCGGKGGSMHLTDTARGALGSFAIVGGHLPIAVGAAFAARYRGSGAVTVCFFGDGTTNIGAFHESLNLASVWKLPAIFVCENNLYGEYSPVATTTPIERLADRADAYAMAKARVDGNDVTVMHGAVLEAAERARAGGGPTLIEALTYRQKGHSRSDPATYRPEGELERWLARDPIALHERALLEAGVEAERVEAVRAGAAAAVAEALERARSWPEPEPDSRFEDVWA